MAIIRPSLVKRPELGTAKVLRPSQSFGQPQDAEEIPFVPAFDLLEQLENRLSDDEAAAIACALIILMPETTQGPSGWGMQGRIEGVNQRGI